MFPNVVSGDKCFVCSEQTIVTRSVFTMISHETLYSLANSLGSLAVLSVVAYHFVAVNAKYVSRDAPSNGANGH